MDIRKLQRAIVDGLEDVKAQDIAVFNTEHLTPLFERVIVASGTSNRQTKALASSVRDAVKARGFEVLRTEGESNGEWIIVDCGAAVAHIMQPDIRRYYHLEEIWGEKPVAFKRAAARGLVKAEETTAVKSAGHADPKPAVKPRPGGPTAKAAAKKAPARKGAARAGAAGPSGRSSPTRQGAASQPSAKKSAAKKTVNRKAPSAGTATARSAAKSAVPRTPVAAKKTTRRA